MKEMEEKKKEDALKLPNYKQTHATEPIILTYKVKHKKNLGLELFAAKQVAKFAIEHRGKLSSKDVKHFGLKSAISNQILRKYGKDYKANKIEKVKLTIPGQSVQMIDAIHGIFYIPCLDIRLTLDKMNQLKTVAQVNHMYHLLNMNQFGVYYRRIRRVELDETYAYISCEIEPNPMQDFNNNVGIYIHKDKIIAACYETGKVIKHTIRTDKGELDSLHKASRRIVNFAFNNRATIKIHEYTGKGRPLGSTQKAMLSPRYHTRTKNAKRLLAQLQYKCQLSGVPLETVHVDEMVTVCSKCGNIGMTEGKRFQCLTCGHKDEMDVNIAFNIAQLR